MKNFVKFVFDRFAALFGLIVCFLPILFIACIVVLRDGYPAFFIQKRVGRNGRLFKMIKFRTMKKNDSKNTVSVKGDSRITNTGAFLRKYKLDELPELLNVLVGQMSMVGPRPDVPGYADTLQGEDRKILQLRPGVTGPATLKYANEEELLASVEDPIKYNDDVIFPDKVRMNLKYYYNHNLILDLKIIFATIFRKKVNL
jgi:lipopolysaccharide/colanic/teichoic acid biosynthesis glycosyltransferase